MRDLRFTVAGLAFAAAVLTGCSEKQEATTTLPPTSATETTEALPQLGPSDFPVPDHARSKDEAGVDAFGHYLVELINRQQIALDGQPLRDLGPDCHDCLRIAQSLDEAAEAGQRIEGGALSIVGRPGITFRGDTANFNFIGRIEAVAMYDAGGALVPGSDSPAEGRVPSGFEFAWSAEQKAWLVSGAFFG